LNGHQEEKIRKEEREGETAKDIVHKYDMLCQQKKWTETEIK
jgi:hypothetical protein